MPAIELKYRRSFHSFIIHSFLHHLSLSLVSTVLTLHGKQQQQQNNNITIWQEDRESLSSAKERIPHRCVRHSQETEANAIDSIDSIGMQTLSHSNSFISKLKTISSSRFLAFPFRSFVHHSHHLITFIITMSCRTIIPCIHTIHSLIRTIGKTSTNIQHQCMPSSSRRRQNNPRSTRNGQTNLRRAQSNNLK